MGYPALECALSLTLSLRLCTSICIYIIYIYILYIYICQPSLLCAPFPCLPRSRRGCAIHPCVGGVQFTPSGSVGGVQFTPASGVYNSPLRLHFVQDGCACVYVYVCAYAPFPCLPRSRRVCVIHPCVGGVQFTPSGSTMALNALMDYTNYTN